MNRSLTVLACFIVCSQLASKTVAAETVDYVRQIKPILQKHCYKCHGPRERESGLRVDTAAALLQGGVRGPAMKTGKANDSLIIQAINGTIKDLRMPPDGPSPSAAEVALLTAWIDQGAKAPDEKVLTADDPRRQHWSWQPIRRPNLPSVNAAGWCRTPIDRFILARLEKSTISPSPIAGRTTLIRRLSLDLLGLPPSVADVDRFLADKASGAYERLVDRLLASPNYGERWGRHWLDAARYGDSNGFTIDSARSIWPYRDWVINALNANMPFDQFAIEQIAGDMLPDATQAQIVATGFHRNTLRNEEGGTDQEQFRVEAVVDRVNTTGSVFLGLTVGCAQCHDHKYDPISQREYYQLYAFLNNAAEPSLELSTPDQKQQAVEIAKQVSAAAKRLKDFDAKAQVEWERNLSAAAGKSSVTWTVLDPAEFVSSAKSQITELEDHSLLVSGGDTSQDTFTVVTNVASSGITAVRLETLTHASLPSRGPGLAANGNFVLGEFQLTVQASKAPAANKPADPVDVTWQSATADFSQDAFNVSGTIDGKPKTGWGIYGGTSRDHAAIYAAKQPIKAAAGSRLVFKFVHNAYNASYKIGHFRLSVTASPAGGLTIPEPVRTALQTPLKNRTKAQLATLANAYLAATTDRKPLQAEVDKLKKEQASHRKTVTSTLIMRESSPRETHIHIRGDFLRKAQRVYPDVPEILPPLTDAKLSAEAIKPKDAATRQPNRLDLARWLVGDSNPLTARVTVNRIWQRYFGVGLVETENDFGLQGTLPSHPELLDWLASEFVRLNWDVKALQRLIVTSTVYRLSSYERPELAEIDANNKLLARQRRLRLEAESVRDVALCSSGLLTGTIGGPSVYPPQPKGIDSFTQTKKNWRDSTGADRYRRGMYTFFWRSNPHPFLMTFDAPDGNAACTRRARSNTPLQALTLANDITFVELAQGLAVRVLTEIPDDTNARIDFAVQCCLGRRPNEVEHEVLLTFLDEQQQAYAASPKDAAAFAPSKLPKDVTPTDAAAWTAVGRLLMNLDEFITRE